MIGKSKAAAVIIIGLKTARKFQQIYQTKKYLTVAYPDTKPLQTQIVISASKDWKICLKIKIYYIEGI